MKALNVFISLSLMTSLAFGQLFINEIDYDQPGTDAGEFIEIAGPAGTYTNVSIDHYNGNGGALIWSLDLPAFTLTDEASGYGFYVIGVTAVPNVDLSIPGSIQNGAPDGVELLVNGSVVDAIAYEGEMNDSEGNAMESATGDFAGVDSSMGRIGIDGSPWEYGPFSPGALNTNQTFDPTVNYPPSANAGADQSVASGATVTLDGSASSDADGTIVSYLWEQTSGSTVTLTDATTDVATFVVPEVTETTSWGFSLTVTDDEAATDTDDIVITVSISAAMTILEARGQALGTLITITGLVNSVNFSGGGSEYTVEDATAGIDMYLGGVPIDLGLGDEITVTGTTAEYNGKYEILPATAGDIVVNSTGNTLPDPQVITAAELASNGENYESELVMILAVSNAGTGDAWPASGSDANIDISDASGTTVMRIDKETEIDGSTEPVWPVDVIGVVSEYSGTYNIYPRLLSDFASNTVTPTFSNETHSPEFATSVNEITVTIDIVAGDETQTINSAALMYGTGGTHLNESEMWLDNGSTWMGIIPAQAANSFLEYEIIATAFTTYDTVIDTSEFDSWTYLLAIASSEVATIASIQANPVEEEVVTVEGVITIGSGLLRDDYTAAYIQDESGRGINLFQYDQVELNRGDEITVVGVIDIYNGTVEITDFSYQLISTGNTLPAPVVLTPGEANELEFEGTWLKITGTVTDTWSAGGGQNVLIGDGSDTCVVRIWETTGVDVTPLTVGTEWSFLGVESQYNGVFQLLVAYDADIMSTSDIDVIDTKPSQFGLNPAYPNPFNPSTTLSWKLESSSEVMLRVMDIRGREVARLAEGTSGPGQFSMSWDASELSSGVYFIQLITPNESAIQKVMLLK
ncbi:MAG: T9SS type A sorting domain-containing protein [Candidatus Marinimicrobia bacterium]|jgi:DNA/RNA endonuclease YhcR with UshA esterase domain|nr:T9SS type A sorting domain-containing protein [Candidatus Neomarinimicrobiota bacterium]MBT3630659.1 T9SS type A sorting domain-containing protein [Candidatus Neomarinimicrobiota bacterium]MBT3825474.1 T9SS type A sorting domain-containing protein [Candidatus Neomarinimicrobiota bacterium]MBT4131235.1 T9SS type A sorting domain-containing protein [Candidatus Neomarinimicrobiota bacterium]MBT4297041.1 T9SS type A sorting domain-containing protein [Candidatus Neomarinimicrobiota bacterium]